MLQLDACPTNHVNNYITKTELKDPCLLWHVSCAEVQTIILHSGIGSSVCVCCVHLRAPTLHSLSLESLNEALGLKEAWQVTCAWSERVQAGAPRGQSAGIVLQDWIWQTLLTACQSGTLHRHSLR